MKPTKSEVIVEDPYYKIKFECSNRQFYEVKNDLWKIAEEIGIEFQDGYIDEKCDYEGDLDTIIIYNSTEDMKRHNEVQKFIGAVLKFYGITFDVEGMNVVLSIF